MKQVEVVGAVIVNDSKEILCALRSKNMSLAGMWEFPGGKIETGETPQQALTREIQEELNCTITIGDFITNYHYQYPDVVVHLHTYYARIAAGEPSPQEHERLEWIALEKLSQLNWAPADIPTVNMLLPK